MRTHQSRGGLRVARWSKDGGDVGARQSSLQRLNLRGDRWSVEAVIDFERGVSHATRGGVRGEGQSRVGHAGQAEKERVLSLICAPNGILGESGF